MLAIALASCVYLSSTTPTDQAKHLSLDVDLRDVQRSLVHVQEQVPIGPGQAILVYPKWGPGVSNLHFVPLKLISNTV
jgi:hypothetical protein